MNKFIILMKQSTWFTTFIVSLSLHKSSKYRLETFRRYLIEEHCSRCKMLVFDFHNIQDLSSWSELSDTVRSAGKSKATMDIYKTKSKQSAILFTFLKPQPNGAGFCGVRTVTPLNLEGFKNIYFVCNASGNATRYKIVLRHDNQNNEPYPSYEQSFEVNLNAETVVRLPLENFKPYYRGKALNTTDTPTLDLKNITAFGIQVAGGVYENDKQSGISALEFDQIWAEA